MKVLVIDSCVRKENSRTLKILNGFLEEIKGHDIKILQLEDLNLNYLTEKTLLEKEANLKNGNMEAFALAQEFADADLLVVAAPFWDMGLPAILRVYIENISVDGVTFVSTPKGLVGKCKAKNMVYITSRGGIYGENSDLEIASVYLKALCKFYYIDNFSMVAADGTDIVELDCDEIIKNAIIEAKNLAKSLNI